MERLLSIGSLILTVLVFWGAKRLYRRRQAILLSPVLVAPLLLMLLIWVTNVPYQAYASGAKWLTSLLGPATVAMAVPMYRHFNILKQHAKEILAGVLLGSSLAILSSVLLAAWVHLGADTLLSLIPRSVTTPIAIEISRSVGGLPPMTAVFVIVTGISGIILGPLVIRWLPIRTPVARGVLFGMGAHATGTSKAFELGAVEGTVSSIAMILAAGMTLMLIPVLLPMLQTYLHL